MGSGPSRWQQGLGHETPASRSLMAATANAHCKRRKTFSEKQSQLDVLTPPWSRTQQEGVLKDLMFWFWGMVDLDEIDFFFFYFCSPTTSWISCFNKLCISHILYVCLFDKYLLCSYHSVIPQTFIRVLVHPKGNQSWIFIGRTDAEAETPILWPPDAKNWLIEKDPDAGKDWRREEKGMTEDEMAGLYHQRDGQEFE